MPFQFDSADVLLKLCEQNKMSIAEIHMANETALFSKDVVKARLLHIAQVMKDSISTGCNNSEGELPGGLHVRRRAPHMFKQLSLQGKPATYRDINSLDWLSLYALAVSEENAVGGRIVTAPTNGASGIIPAVLNFYTDFYPDVTDEKIVVFLLTAGAIGILFKKS